MEAIIKKILDKAEKDKDILAVALFGSSLKRKGRDIDICLFLKDKKSNLEMSRKRLSYSKFHDKIDIQIFQQLPVYIRIQILKQHKILLNKDISALYNIAFDTIREFGFYKKIYDLYLNNIKNG